MFYTFLPKLKYFLIIAIRCLGALTNAVLKFAMMSEVKDIAMNFKAIKTKLKNFDTITMVS